MTEIQHQHLARAGAIARENRRRGRPTVGQRTKVTVSLSPEWAEVLAKGSAAQHKSRGNVIQDALRALGLF